MHLAKRTSNISELEGLYKYVTASSIISYIEIMFEAGIESSGLVFIVILSGLEYLLGKACTLGFIIGVYDAV